MSSAVHITPEKTVQLPDWEKFCRKEKIEYNPYVVGGSTYYYGGNFGVEIHFGYGPVQPGPPPFAPPKESKEIIVSHFWMGPRLEEVAMIARKILDRFPGNQTCDPELKRLMDANA